MNKMIKSENGYSLLLTMSVFLLFTVLALSILTVSITGAKRNQVSESNLQAIELANKGIESLKNYIYQKMNHQMGSNGITHDQLCNIIDQYDYDNENEVITGIGEFGEFSVYVENDTNTCQSSNFDAKVFTLISTGKTTDGHKKTVEAKVDFSHTELETLKYALSTRKSNRCIVDQSECLPGEGNLFLHGGVSITGDIRVDGNLFATDHGYENYGLVIGFDDFKFNFDQNRWIPSVKPSLIGSNGPARIVLGGEAYTYSHSPNNYFNHVQTSSFNNNSNYKMITDNISQVFSTNVRLTNTPSENMPEDFNIVGEKNNFIFNAKDTSFPIEAEKIEHGFLWWKEVSYVIVNKYLPISNVTPKYKNDYTNDFILLGKNHFNKLSTDGSLTIESNPTYNQTSIIFNQGAYIKKDLIIGNGSDSNNVKDYSNVNIDGPIYVDGNLIIKGAYAKMNSIFYVDGDVVIENSRIEGLKKNDGSNGSMIIFATGTINIRNNNVYVNDSNSINPIRGFFYSQNSIEMFGTASTIKVDGGLSASRIILNGVQGRASDNIRAFTNDTYNNRDKPYTVNTVEINLGSNHWLVDLIEGFFNFWNKVLFGEHYFDTVEKQKNLPPRLQINYNEEMIEETLKTYADLKTRESYITNIEKPKINERTLHEQ